jgi:predicted ester cyclase
MSIFIFTSLFFLTALLGAAGLLAAMTRQYWQRIGAMLSDCLAHNNSRSGGSSFASIGAA